MNIVSSLNSGFIGAATLFLSPLIANADSGARHSPYSEGPLQDLVSAMPPGSWLKVNVNRFSSVWTPDDLRPLRGASNPSPAAIIGAWSSFAWDSNRGDLIIYGGGHANYPGNDVYRWRARSLLWERASLPSEIQHIGSAVFTAIDGPDAAPASAHTYDNSVFLPKADRFLTFGGAIFDSGGTYGRLDEQNPGQIRPTGPYLLDPSKADGSKVGGSTGSHVQRVNAFPEIKGSHMWENRDIYRTLTGLSLPGSHVNGCTARSDESSGSDVVYFVANRGGSTDQDLYRYEIVDAALPWLDEVRVVGIYWGGAAGKGTCAHDPVNQIVLRTGSNLVPFGFWDLTKSGPDNKDHLIARTDSIVEMITYLESTNRVLADCGMDHDAGRGGFLVWCGAGEVWRLSAPETLSTAGWQVVLERGPGEPGPSGQFGTGVLGKWEYVPGFDVFIGLEDPTKGDVWVYRPLDGTAPQVDSDGDGVHDDLDNCVAVANTDQRDTDRDGFGNACDGDLNNDAVVNFADLALFRTRFGSTDAAADLNGDGVVNFADLAILVTLFGKPPGPSGLTNANTSAKLRTEM